MAGPSHPDAAGWVCLGLFLFFCVLVPLSEVERRVNVARKDRRRRREEEMAELQKDNPDWQRVPPEARLAVMRDVLVAAKQDAMAAEVEKRLRQYRRPAWRSWAFLPVAVFNLAAFGLVMGGAVSAGLGAGGLITAGVVAVLGLLTLNGVMMCETGCHEIPDGNDSAARHWMPSAPWRGEPVDVSDAALSRALTCGHLEKK